MHFWDLADSNNYKYYSLIPSLTFNSPFSLLSSTLRFSIAALCTTNFSWFWFHGKTPWCGSTFHRAASSDWIYVETWSAYRGGKDSTFRRSFCVLKFSFAGYLTDIQISCFAWRAMRLHLVLKRTRNFPAIPSAKMPWLSRLLRLVEETWHHSLKPHWIPPNWCVLAACLRDKGKKFRTVTRFALA